MTGDVYVRLIHLERVTDEQNRKIRSLETRLAQAEQSARIAGMSTSSGNNSNADEFGYAVAAEDITAGSSGDITLADSSTVSATNNWSFDIANGDKLFYRKKSGSYAIVVVDCTEA